MPYDPGLMDEIRCDEKDYLIWKWRSEGISRRENAIRWGSSLCVRDGSVAVRPWRSTPSRGRGAAGRSRNSSPDSVGN